MVNYNPNPSPRLDFNFRSADTESVFRLVHAGVSAEIIGVGSVGKSNFVRHLVRRDVQDQFLYGRFQEQAHCVFIGLDANSLLAPIPSAMDPTQPSSWNGYELITSRLLRAVATHQLLNHLPPGDPAHPDQLYAMYLQMWPEGSDKVHIIAFRYLEDIVQRIFDVSNNLRLIFIFDEFEKFLAELPPRFFQTLRSLRDQYKDRVIYLTTSRQIMPLLIDQNRYDDYEPFIELFSRHFLLPYRPSDTEQTFRRMSVRRDLPAPPLELREQLMAVTGGHAGLLRAAFSAYAPHNLLKPNMSDIEVISTLLHITEIQDECKTIWRSLSPAERQVLFGMVRARQQQHDYGVNAHEPYPRLMINKGILLETGTMNFDNIRPHLFASFLLNAISPDVNSAENVDMHQEPNI
jgi:hypothetical protein